MKANSTNLISFNMQLITQEYWTGNKTRRNCQTGSLPKFSRRKCHLYWQHFKLNKPDSVKFHFGGDCWAYRGNRFQNTCDIDNLKG